MTPFERARRIVGGGGQILLPYNAGDAQVTWFSRRNLVQEIEQEIIEAVMVAEENR